MSSRVRVVQAEPQKCTEFDSNALNANPFKPAKRLASKFIAAKTELKFTPSTFQDANLPAVSLQIYRR